MNLLNANGSVLPASLVAAWDATGLSGAVSSWASSVGSKTLTQGTAGNQPSAVSSIFGSQPGVLFDGSSDVLTMSSAVTSATAAGTLALVFKTGASVAGPFVLCAAVNSAVAADWVEFGISSTGKLYMESNASGTKHTVYGSTVLDVSTAYLAILCWDGTDYYLSLGTTEENPLTIENVGTFAWFGRIGGTPAFHVGANIPSGGAARFFNGHVGSVYFWSVDITA